MKVVVALFWLALLGEAASQEICLSGFIMDFKCIDLGFLLDTGDETLRFPERHSVHCLVDVDSCVESGFAVLQKLDDDELYTPVAKLDEKGNELALTVSRNVGSCSTCDNGYDSSKQRTGFRATVVGTMDDSTNPPTMQVTQLLNGDVCDNLPETSEPEPPASTEPPTVSPTMQPTNIPTQPLTNTPSLIETIAPSATSTTPTSTTSLPTVTPTTSPTATTTSPPTVDSTISPSTSSPTSAPSVTTASPSTLGPTTPPTTTSPTIVPTMSPSTSSPTSAPSVTTTFPSTLDPTTPPTTASPTTTADPTTTQEPSTSDSHRKSTFLSVISLMLAFLA